MYMILWPTDGIIGIIDCFYAKRSQVQSPSGAFLEPMCSDCPVQDCNPNTVIDYILHSSKGQRIFHMFHFFFICIKLSVIPTSKSVVVCTPSLKLKFSQNFCKNLYIS